MTRCNCLCRTFRHWFSPARLLPVVHNHRLRLNRLEDRTVPTVYIVANAGDSGAGSLRQAVLDANANGGADSITFDPTFFATAKTITLASEIAINDTLTITGPTARVSVSGGGVTRIFHTSPAPVGATITINNLTLSGGSAASFGGGAIRAHGQILSLTDCALIGNTAGAGGAIFFGGSFYSRLNMTRSSVTGNLATGDGGGIYMSYGGFQIVDSTIASNKAGGNGGGLRQAGTSVTALFRNSTIVGNSAASGGGAVGWNNINGHLYVQNSTIVGNTVGTGIGWSSGGIANNTNSNYLVLESTILSGNTAVGGPNPDLISSGPVIANVCAIGSKSGASNFSGDATTTALLGQNFMLGSLANNGGPTQTIELLPGSPLINTGSNPASLTNDQRGAPYARSAGAKTDVGAFEFPAPAPPTVIAVAFGDGSNQRSIVKQIVVTFSESMTFTGSVASAFTLHRSGTGGATGDVTLTASPSSGPTSSVTLTFSGSLTEYGSLVDGLYDFTIDAAQVSSANGALDGNSDGNPGGNYSKIGTTANKFFRLFGDADGNGAVNATDFLTFRLAFLGTGSTFDFDSDGIVNGADFLQFRLRFLHSV